MTDTTTATSPAATAPATAQLIAAATGSRVVQLGHPLLPGQTRNGSAPPFGHTLSSRFDRTTDQVPGQSPDIAGASDMIALGCHTGTHMDSLAHVSYEGRLFDGSPIDGPGVVDDFRGVTMAGRENFEPIVARAVLFDFARHLGVERAPADYVITPDELHACAQGQGLTFGAGDVVLFRTGYDTIYRDSADYLTMPIPGPDPATARELVAAGVVATGSDTMPYEAAPGDEPMQVHAELIPKGGVYIFEMLDLRELAALAPQEFLFVALPLRIAGGTGSPINPIALVGP